MLELEGDLLAKHLSLETMAKLMAGDLSHEVLTTQVVSHFLDLCPDCRRQYEEVGRLQQEVGHWDERVAVFERAQAPELFAALRDLPFGEQLARVADDESFHTWGLCCLLLQESLEAGFEDASLAINYAELAVTISLQLDDAYDPHWVSDLRARAYAHLGNARRVFGELRSAEGAFHEADRFLAKSMTGNDNVLAEVLHLKSSLRRAQRRLDDAMVLVDQALDLYRENEAAHDIAVVLLKKAKILEEREDIDEAVQLLQELVAHLSPDREPVLALYARHNLILCLARAERFSEAAALIPEVQPLFARHGKPLDLVRLRWTEGKTFFGLGQLETAETVFREVQQQFLQQGMGYDAALVSLDLAILYAREHRIGDLKRLAVEMQPIFGSRDVHREAVAALLMFQNACEEERLTAELAVQFAAQLLRGRRGGQ